MLTNKRIKSSTKTKNNSSKKKFSFASAEAVEGNNDLLTIILLLLSPKPLFKCKLVCKRWHSLISDPKFASLWGLKTTPFGGCFFVNRFWRKDNRSFTYLYISFTDNGLSHSKASLKGLQNSYGEGVVILNSCGGLLVCRTVKKERNVKPICKYYVCNPTTNQFVSLPEITYMHTEHRYGDAADFLHMTLAFDYSVSSHFKVISSDRRLSSSYEMGIYSSETNLWRNLTCQISKSVVRSVDFNNGVFVNRAIFWPAYKSETSIYFDVDTESFHPYPMPSKRREAMYFGSLKDRLYYIRSKRSYRLDIFEFEKDTSSWCCKYQIYEFPETNFSQISFVTLICGDEDRFLVICTQPSGMVLSINLENSSCTNLCKLLLRVSDMKELSNTCGSALHYLSENPFWVGSKRDITCNATSGGF